MSGKPKILVQLDGDAHASVFDAVVAVDSGVEHLLQYHWVEPAQVRDLVHGAMFTRGVADLAHTAIFIGGSNVAAGEKLLEQAKKCFFGPMRVSVMLDANGANTTAAAAVLAAERHLVLTGVKALVLAASGAVGQRVVRLLARAGAHVLVASRSAERASEVCQAVGHIVPGAALSPYATANPAETQAALKEVQLVIAAGAAGVELVPNEVRQACPNLKVAIDLNAVPPAGIRGIDAMDKGTQRDGTICYGAVGVGGTKMKIHKAAIAQLFEASDRVLDAEEIYAIGRGLAMSGK
jgi:hypothetical protein